VSDFYEERPDVFVLDDRAQAREDREYEAAEVAQERLVDDRDLVLADEDTARRMAMCMWCRQTSALPGDDFCSACSADIFGTAA
jgi:hypothetical protein